MWWWRGFSFLRSALLLVLPPLPSLVSVRPSLSPLWLCQERRVVLASDE